MAAGSWNSIAILAESRGLDPLPYEEQPYYPNPDALPETGGPHLVYLDVWEREVTVGRKSAIWSRTRSESIPRRACRPPGRCGFCLTWATGRPAPRPTNS